jgi:Outer membrane lipoprotein-sorting protein
MSELSRRRRLAIGGAIAVAMLSSVRVGSADQALSNEELLRRTDLGALAPESFRSRMRLTAGDKPPLEVEVWRKGEARTLVRLLGPKERGKYLLRLGSVLWFLAPGAKKPVRLSPSYRLSGSATLDDVLGLQYARDYKVTSAADLDGGLVALELAARGPGAIYPAVRYVVRPSTLRPVRAEYRVPSGKVATVVEFAEWSAGGRPYATRLLVRDALHGGATTAVDVLEVEPRPVPDGLFDLADPAARQQLEAAP